jgi:hypothetical protein
MFGLLTALFDPKANAQASDVPSDLKFFSKTDTSLFYPPFSTDSLNGIHFETAKFLWERYVPKSGQAETVQGELIRASERLDHEIRDNGKINWSQQFVILGEFLKETLIGSKVFPHEVEREIQQDIDSLIGDTERVVTEDAVYARISRRIVEWYWRHREPIKHTYNPALKI